jgi:hypothetical protein
MSSTNTICFPKSLLERAYAQRDSGLGETQSWPLLRKLHGDPRWESFLGKMGFSGRRAGAA